MRMAGVSGASKFSAIVVHWVGEKHMAKGRKKVQTRKAASRKPASRKANARRAVSAKTRPKKQTKHRFAVSHLNEADFDQGLRTYAKYRDLGLAAATGGMVQAHV